VTPIEPAVRLRLAACAASSRRHLVEQRALDAEYVADAARDAAECPLWPRAPYRVPGWVLAHHEVFGEGCQRLADGEALDDVQAWARDRMRAHGRFADDTAEMLANTLERIRRDLRRGHKPEEAAA
jgi:hypothetical protein